MRLIEYDFSTFPLNFYHIQMFSHFWLILYNNILRYSVSRIKLKEDVGRSHIHEVAMKDVNVIDEYCRHCDCCSKCASVIECCNALMCDLKTRDTLNSKMML
ncbi:uncharacterized protein LOC134188795 [Corticium candelabrum]|uniref:uncharacterized protein LOC134188795 n=1 Tax=Corticium candelabrum TaxID=121492 RepID=UPI002E267FE4|nr:uncharacterized protein LOC134188795 [Corticium candelabrum]